MNTPDSRIYVGRLDGSGPVVYAVDPARAEQLGAIDWGIDAAALAQVLLTDASGTRPPAGLRGRFADEVLSRLPRDGFALPRETVGAWLRRVVV